MGVISNNLANVNTMGYKRGRAAFSDLIYQNPKQVGAQSSQNTQLPSGLAMGTGVQATATQKIFTQGNIAQTGNTFDLAINGRGFFQILRPDGTQAYTRDGAFSSPEGRVVTSTGYDLQPAIVVPPDAQTITVGVDGIGAQLPGQPTPQPSAQSSWPTSSTPRVSSPSAITSSVKVGPAVPPRSARRR